MNHPSPVELARRLQGQLAGRAPTGARVGEVSVSEYTSAERFERERAAVFRRWPSIVAHQSELQAPGACLAVEVGGVSLIVVRGADGTVRAFRNACRHRSTELLSEAGPCSRKAFVCRYHGWTYDLTGRLIHVPHREAFVGAEQGRAQLVAAHAEARHGWIWVSLESFDLASRLSSLDDELAKLGADQWALYRRSTREVRGNWKLIMDAFLESYHIRHLHRDTLARFFADAAAEADPVGPHIRAVAARKALRPDSALDAAGLRQWVTPNYVLFPNAIVILHPDYASTLLLTPLAADRTRFVHVMTVAEPPRTEAEKLHWAKSFELIDERVLANEDLAVVEAIQRGMTAGADTTLLFGGLEHAALWLHEQVASLI